MEKREEKKLPGLKYKSLSLVYLQVFTMERFDHRKLPAEFVLDDEYIDQQIFNTHSTRSELVRHYKLPSFPFSATIREDDNSKEQGYDTDPVSITGGMMHVEMSVFLDRTVVMSYRMVIDGKGKGASRASRDMDTDEIINLAGMRIGIEHWNSVKLPEDGGESSSIDADLVEFTADNFPLDAEGKPHEITRDAKGQFHGGVRLSVDEVRYSEGEDGNFKSDKAGRYFRDENGIYMEVGLNDDRRDRFIEMQRRYKAFVLSTQASKPALLRQYVSSFWQCLKFWQCSKPEASRRIKDMNYVYVDVWENISHSEDKFKKKKFSDREIIAHIGTEHRQELVGLMSLYPYEWDFREKESFEDICGGNVAIDTDDLVLVNQNICVVFGTYQNRENWKENIKKRNDEWHVSWPEYLVILEMVLARKHTIDVIADKYMDSMPDCALLNNIHRTIEKNALLGVNATRLLMCLDAIKYSRYVSHKIMHERTVQRLDVDKQAGRLRETIEQMDDCLNNLSDMRTLGQSKILNVILGIVSIAALFEILFQEVEMPFLDHLKFNTIAGEISLSLILITVTVVVVAPLALITMSIRNNRIKR